MVHWLASIALVMGVFCIFMGYLIQNMMRRFLISFIGLLSLNSPLFANPITSTGTGGNCTATGRFPKWKKGDIC